jgi:hypothetical protein
MILKIGAEGQHLNDILHAQQFLVSEQENINVVFRENDTVGFLPWNAGVTS